MEKVSWINMFILCLATFRLNHLLVFDKITAFIRKPFFDVFTELNENGEPQQTLQIKGNGLRYWLGSLLSCHWCTGIWCSIVIILFYMYVPVVFPIITILAVAGAAAIIESFIP